MAIRILVTGGSGLLGGAIHRSGREAAHDVVLGYNSNRIGATSLHLDVTRPESVRDAISSVEPDVVVHCAAVTDVDRCEREPRLAYSVNMEGTKNVVDALRGKETHLIHVSTDYVFSGEKGNYSELDERSPINTYGRSKADAEEIVESSTLNWSIVRTSVIFAANPAAGRTNFALWLVNKLRRGEPLDIVTDQIVSPTLASNISEMILNLAENPVTGIIHLAGATQIDRYSFASKLAETMDLEQSLIRPVSSTQMKWTAKRPANSSLDVGKATSALSTKPLRLDEALSRLKRKFAEVAV